MVAGIVNRSKSKKETKEIERLAKDLDLLFNPQYSDKPRVDPFESTAYRLWQMGWRKRAK